VLGGPQRLVCLTAETTELAFALGCGDQVVGVTGYAVRPPEARKKPRVAAFRTAAVDRIAALKPDLVLGFSDLQSTIAADLIRAGITVLITNQRSLAETYDAMQLVANTLGRHQQGQRLVAEFRAGLERLRAQASASPPIVYFEEWDAPLISGIAWVGELIELCGGRDAFPELHHSQDAPNRIIESRQVIERDPDVIVASWCGKKARLDRIAARPGWAAIAAVRTGRLHEIRSPDILAPGLSLLHGARQLQQIIAG
jgi:iron complex transport system substrate-binding protein